MGLNYLQKLCLTQTLYMGELFKDRSLTSILDELIPLYACKEKEQVELRNLIQNNVLTALTSSMAVCIHLNYVGSFCPDQSCFGKKEAEEQALEIKKNVYANIEKVTEDSWSSDFMEVLSKRYKDEDEFAISYAVAICLSGGKSDVYLPLLRKAETNGKAEALILLLALDTTQSKEFYLGKLEKNKMLMMQKNVVKDIEIYYMGKKEDGV